MNCRSAGGRRAVFGGMCVVSALISGCAPAPPPQADIPRVPLSRLLRSPSEFHLKEVQTTGYLFAHENVGAIFLSLEAASGFDPSAGIRTFQGAELVAEKPFDKEYAEVVGVFAAEFGRSGPWLGTITLREAQRVEDALDARE